MVEDAKHARASVAGPVPEGAGLAHKLFDILNEEGRVHAVDNGTMCRRTGEAVDMVDGAVTADHRGIVGPLVDEDPEGWNGSYSGCDVAEGALNRVMSSH